MGLKYFFPAIGNLVFLNFYAGAGLKYYFVENQNNFDSHRKTIKRNGLGAVGELGFITTIYDHLILDFFVSYSLKSFGTPSGDRGDGRLKLTGVNVGGGIGYMF